MELPDAELNEDYVLYELVENGKALSRESLIFCEPKNFHFRDPKLEWRIEDDFIIVESSAYAKDVEILNEQEDIILEDNYFDMVKGEEKKVRIIEGTAKGISLRSVFNIR